MASIADGVFSGPRCRFMIGTDTDLSIVAYAGGVSIEESIDYEPVDVLDCLTVKEYVPVGYRASMACRLFRVVGLSAKQRGIFPKEGNILTSGDLRGALEDELTGKIVAQVEGVKAASKSFDVPARGMVTENMNFVCIRVKDEAETAAP